MERIWNSLRGPELYHVYQDNNVPSHFYDKNVAERFSGSVIKWVNILWRYKLWVSPVFFFVAYKRESLSIAGLLHMLPYLSSFIILIIASNLVRGFGRLLSSEYQTFLLSIIAFQKDPTADNKRRISKYDYDFTAWPIDYNAPSFNDKSPAYSRNCNYFFYLVSGVCVKLFGIKLLYPGSMSLLQSMLGPSLMEGREKLITQHNAIRLKLKTGDQNIVDAIFVDRRNNNTTHGKKLVVCSEGNAGFYEIGCMSTPLEAGFSVVGWNHPGFSGSTGQPLPAQEQRAMDAVMQYSINILNFHPSEIILFAWSIGGYTASWASMMYPDVHSVVLDATFDHIAPLALSHMPPSWGKLIGLAIPNHLNLNNAQLLCQYQGRIQLVRRSKDETITTSEINPLASNRGNNLLLEVFKHRYPLLMDTAGVKVLQHWLSCDKHLQGGILDSFEIKEDVESFANKSIETFPSKLGEELDNKEKEKTIICLAREYMVDFDSTHCTQLPSQIFRHLKVLKSL